MTLIIAMMLTFVALMNLKPVSAYADTNMYADPAVISRKDLQVGDTFTLDIRLENGTAVVVIGFDMSWDPYYLNLTSLTAGDALPGGSFLIGFWDSAAGYVDDVSLGVLGASYDVTNNTAATAVFEVMHPGSSVIDIYGCEVYDETLQLIYEGDPVYDCTAHLSEVLVHPVVWDSVTYYVATESNSTVTHFNFSQPAEMVYFNVTGEDGIGYVNVTIPKALLDVLPGYEPPDTWEIFVDNVNVTASMPTPTSNATHSFVYLTYTHSEHFVEVRGNWAVPEFPALIMVFIILAATIIALVSVRKVYILEYKRRYS
jgi:hypothetical protein